MRDLLVERRHPDFWGDPRRRATAILVLLAVFAALIVSFMVFFVGTSGGRQNTNLLDAGPTTQPTQASPRVTHPVSTAGTTLTTPPSSTPVLPKPTSTANPCPSRTPCTVPGDQGGVAIALNKFRVSHGLPPVPVAATARAQQCALLQGDGPSCQPHYAWQPVSTQDGAQVISKIAKRDGGQWLLDPAVASFSVGWAYTPSAGGGPGQFGCAVIKVG